MKSYKLLREAIINEGILINKKTFRRGDLVKVAGTRDTNVYFIISGSVKAYFINNDEERILYFGYEDSIITSLDSFISNSKSKIEIKAIKKTEVYCLAKKDFEFFLNSNVAYLKLWNQVLGDIILYQFQREQELLLNSPEERYSRALERNPDIFQKIPNKHIASYLRMAPETLSRLKKS